MSVGECIPTPPELRIASRIEDPGPPYVQNWISPGRGGGGESTATAPGNPPPPALNLKKYAYFFDIMSNPPRTSCGDSDQDSRVCV